MLSRLTVATRRRLFSTAAAASESDWGALQENPWGTLKAGFMYVAELKEGETEWTRGEMKPYGNIPMSPSAGVLNYSQSVLEGLKLYKHEDERLIRCFRPDQNAKRLQTGCERLCIPSIPVDLFVQAVEEMGRANVDFIPPADKGSLYLRPLVLGTGPVLGIGPAPSYTFVIYGASVPGRYYGGGGSALSSRLKVETTFHRAAKGGTGGVKLGGNYGASIYPIAQAQREQFSNVLYLDAEHSRYLEEAGTSNVFYIKGNTLFTPALTGTILPGITRDSVLTLAKAKGLDVVEKQCPVEELLEADEAFTCGTAVIISPITSVSYGSKTKEFGENPKTTEIYEELKGVQLGTRPDKHNWVHSFPASS